MSVLLRMKETCERAEKKIKEERRTLPRGFKWFRCLGREVKWDRHGGGGNRWQKRLLTSWRPGSWAG